MKVKVKIIVEFEDEKLVFFEKSDNVDYSDVEGLINEASIRADEFVSRRRINEQNDEE